jgi:hypothetical protein
VLGFRYSSGILAGIRRSESRPARTAGGLDFIALGSMASADFWFSGAVSPVLILQKRYRLFKIERIKA